MIDNLILNFAENDEPSWVLEQAQLSRRNTIIEQKSELEARLKKIRAKELRQKQKYESGEPKAKRTVRCCNCLKFDVIR